MNIPVSLLRRIIQEEMTALAEVHYDEEGNPLYTEPSDAPTPDEAEVLIKGYGGLQIKQIKEQLIQDLATMAEAAAEGNFRRIGSSRLEILTLFLKTLEAHQALGD